MTTTGSRGGGREMILVNCLNGIGLRLNAVHAIDGDDDGDVVAC